MTMGTVITNTAQILILKITNVYILMITQRNTSTADISCVFLTRTNSKGA
jgi:hypothetical protein